MKYPVLYLTLGFESFNIDFIGLISLLTNAFCISSKIMSLMMITQMMIHIVMIPNISSMTVTMILVTMCHENFRITSKIK